MSQWKTHYDEARLELKRAEELLKQRHENTRKILEKQKALQADLEKERERRKHAETEVKKYLKENKKLMDKVSMLERSLSSVDVQVKGETPHRAVAITSNGGPPAQKKHKRPPLKKPKNQREEHVSKAEKLRELLKHLLNGDRITHDGIQEVASIVNLTPSPWDQSDIISVAHDSLMQCCVKGSYVPRLAPITWAPCHWFPDSKHHSQNRFHGIANYKSVKSMVSMWCTETAIVQDWIPWLLQCMHIIDQASPRGCNLVRDLTLRAYDATLEALEQTHPSIPSLCCNATITMALWRHANDIRSAAVFVRDILVAPCHDTTQEQMILVALSAALEVWPAALNRHSMGQDAVGRLETLMSNHSAPPHACNVSAINKQDSGLLIMCHHAAIFINAILSF